MRCSRRWSRLWRKYREVSEYALRSPGGGAAECWVDMTDTVHDDT